MTERLQVLGSVLQSDLLCLLLNLDEKKKLCIMSKS